MENTNSGMLLPAWGVVDDGLVMYEGKRKMNELS